MLILLPVQGVMHFLSNAVYYILAISYHIGRGIIYAFSVVFGCLREICAALVIIGEEFYRFLAELDGNINVIIRYCRTTTNTGVGAALDVVALIFKQLANFFTNTKLHTKLLATKCGRFVTNSISLVQRALLLIADSAWWLLTIIPKTVAHILVEIGDALVLSVGGICRLLVMLVQSIIDDVFRYTIAVGIVFALFKNRWRLLRLLRVSLRKTRLLYRMSINSFARPTRLRLRSSPMQSRPVNMTAAAHSVRRESLPRLSRESLPRPTSSSPLTADKLVESQRCVICQDKQKCVLLLPCKHLCLCENCADYMVYTSDTQHHCPLCRGEIRQSISVYT